MLSTCPLLKGVIDICLQAATMTMQAVAETSQASAQHLHAAAVASRQWQFVMCSNCC